MIMVPPEIAYEDEVCIRTLVFGFLLGFMVACVIMVIAQMMGV